MSGLGPESLAFLEALAANNNRDWFHANKRTYERDLKRPAQAFSDAMAAALGEAFGVPHKPRIFRIVRDVRFSKDKTPYNAHLRISFVPQAAGAPPAWMFGLEPGSLVLGVGIFGFDGKVLDTWRTMVADAAGEKLADVMQSLSKKGVRFSEPELKRVPAPFAKDHPRDELLRRKGLTAWLDQPDVASAFGEDAPARCLAEFTRLQGVYDWLMELNRTAA